MHERVWVLRRNYHTLTQLVLRRDYHPQIAKALLGIQDSFEAQIEKLRNLDYTVLDVTTSRWHDDYNSFKDVVKDLEVSLSDYPTRVFLLCWVLRLSGLVTSL